MPGSIKTMPMRLELAGAMKLDNVSIIRIISLTEVTYCGNNLGLGLNARKELSLRTTAFPYRPLLALQPLIGLERSQKAVITTSRFSGDLSC
jgi:hypothetical protein